MPANHENLPPCLIWPADPDDLQSWVLNLPQLLFGQLQGSLASQAAPLPEILWAAWRARPSSAMAQAVLDVSDDTMTSWLHAYELAWGIQSKAGDPTSVGSQPSYVQASAALLLGSAARITVPIGTVDGHQAGRMQCLCFEKIESNASKLHTHPQFAWHEKRFSMAFLEGLAKAWQQAEGHNARPCQVFWHLTEADGSAVKSSAQDGTSATGAALRALWHLRHGLCLDEHVYVFTSCTEAEGSIKAVDHLREKIQAIKITHFAHSQHPPTLVVAKSLSADDAAALKAARGWAEVVQVGTVDELIAVRSCVASAAIDYLALLAEKLNPLLLPGTTRQVRLSDVHVPAHVWKEERRMTAFADGPGDQAGEKDWRPPGYDPSVADREAGPRLEQAKRQVRVSWDTEFRRTHRTSPLVLVGGPGLGKTTVLRWTSRQMALESAAQLESRQQSLHEIAWPVLAVLAAWAEQTEQPRESLIKATLSAHPIPETWPSLRQTALRLLLSERLFTASEHTFIFLDALDQVGEGYETKLRDWFTQLTDFTSRLVISTRESGLRTHSKTVSFPHLIQMQTAAFTADEAGELAAKWLGTEQAARLQGHLRSHPSLSLVVDSPLLLTLACIVQSSQPDGALPETPADLYQEIMRSLARGDWRASSAAAWVADPDDLIASLERIAWRLFVKSPGVNRFERSVIVDAIERATGNPLAQAKELLATLVDLGFLESAGREAREEHFHFRHTTFLEFLASRHVARRINMDGWNAAKVSSWFNGWHYIKAKDILTKNVLHSKWYQLASFALAGLHDRTHFLQHLLSEDSDDVHRHGLLMAMAGYRNENEEIRLRMITSLDWVLECFVERHYLDRVLKQNMCRGLRCLAARPELCELVWGKIISCRSERDVSLDEDFTVIKEKFFPPRLLGLLCFCFKDHWHDRLHAFVFKSHTNCLDYDAIEAVLKNAPEFEETIALDSLLKDWANSSSFEARDTNDRVLRLLQIFKSEKNRARIISFLFNEFRNGFHDALFRACILETLLNYGANLDQEKLKALLHEAIFITHRKMLSEGAEFGHSIFETGIDGLYLLSESEVTPFSSQIQSVMEDKRFPIGARIAAAKYILDRDPTAAKVISENLISILDSESINGDEDDFWIKMKIIGLFGKSPLKELNFSVINLLQHWLDNNSYPASAGKSSFVRIRINQELWYLSDKKSGALDLEDLLEIMDTSGFGDDDYALDLTAASIASKMLSSTEIVTLLTMMRGFASDVIQILLKELTKRDWRVRFYNKIEVLHRGLEERRADADFGY